MQYDAHHYTKEKSNVIKQVCDCHTEVPTELTCKKSEDVGSKPYTKGCIKLTYLTHQKTKKQGRFPEGAHDSPVTCTTSDLLSEKEKQERRQVHLTAMDTHSFNFKCPCDRSLALKSNGHELSYTIATGFEGKRAEAQTCMECTDETVEKGSVVYRRHKGTKGESGPDERSNLTCEMSENLDSDTEVTDQPKSDPHKDEAPAPIFKGDPHKSL